MASIRKRTWKSGGNIKTAWIADYFDQNGYRHIKTFPRQAAAKAWLAETTIQVKQGIHTAERQSITIAQAAELWFENRRDVERLESATIKQYRNHIRLHIVPKIGGIRLAQLSAPIVDDFKDRLLAANSRVMAGKVLTSLRSILAHAQTKGRVGHNAAAAVRLGAKQRRENGRLEIGRDIPTKDDLRRILNAVQGTRWHPILATAAMAGLRSSELRGLRWSDLDLDVGILRVRQRADETGKMGPPKSAAGARDIPRAPWLVKLLKRWGVVGPGAEGEIDGVFPEGQGHGGQEA